MRNNVSWQYWKVAVVIWPVLISILGCASGELPLPSPPAPGNPEIVLDWPVDGDYPPEQLEIISHVYDPGANISGVQLLIDGELVTTSEVTRDAIITQISQRWPPEAPPEVDQTYLVEVRAIDSSGRTLGEPQYARITIVAQSPQITFQAERSSVKFGDCTTLSWMVENAEAIRLLDGGDLILEDQPGEEPVIEGTYEVCPQTPTHSYSLVAVPRFGNPVEQSLNITVFPTPQPPPEVQLSFEFDQSTYQGFGDPITLFWDVANAQAVRLAGTDLNERNVALRGTEVVYPIQPSNFYHLIVEALYGETFTQTLQFIVPATPTPTHTPTPTSTPTPTATRTPIPLPTAIPTFTPPPTFTPLPTSTPIPPTPVPPPEIACSVDDSTIVDNDCTTVRWTVRNVLSIYLNSDPVTGPTGSRQVCPDSSTTYRLTVNLIGGGTEICEVRVIVYPLRYYYPPTVD